MPQNPKYQTAAERQKAYRDRKRNAPRVTECPRCHGQNTISVSEEIARQFGIYCECLCFDCNGLVTVDGRIWQFHGRAHEVLNWIAFK